MPAFDFHAEDLSRLRRLSFAARMPVMIHQEGQHRSRRSGEGLEFLDYRPYAVGDDLRHVDWSLYARLRQLVVRVFETDENLSVSLLVDISRSMSFGAPVSKVAHACRIACALAYVALSGGERLYLSGFGEQIEPPLGPLNRRGQLGRAVEYLRNLDEQGATSLVECARAWCARRQRRGLVVLVSDFLEPAGYEKALRLLLSRGNKLLVVQVLDPLDVGRGLDGVVRIRDSETGQEQVVAVDESMRRRLQKATEIYCDALAGFCLTHGQHYARTWTQDDYLQVVCHTMRFRWGTK